LHAVDGERSLSIFARLTANELLRGPAQAKVLSTPGLEEGVSEATDVDVMLELRSKTQSGNEDAHEGDLRSVLQEEGAGQIGEELEADGTAQIWNQLNQRQRDARLKQSQGAEWVRESGSSFVSPDDGQVSHISHAPTLDVSMSVKMSPFSKRSTAFLPKTLPHPRPGAAQLPPPPD
jgi:hypothetical protein